VGKVLKLEREYRTTAARCRRLQPAARSRPPDASPLTPELKGFIDRVVVPILVQSYLAEQRSEKQIAEGTATVASCELMTDAPQAEVAR